MSTLGELLRAMPLPAMEEVATTAAAAPRETADAQPASGQVFEEQIHGLVEQLFFQEALPVRNVGFTPVDPRGQTATLCLQVAKAVSREGRYNVGLLDVSSEGPPLQQHLQIPAPFHARVTWPISTRLWLVPRESWRRDRGADPIRDEQLEQLRDFMTVFDFSILYCAPVSWMTMRIAQRCDGLVLILTANETRRLVAAQVKEQLAKARVPLLGTVLTGRRMPVPEALYRRL